MAFGPEWIWFGWMVGWAGMETSREQAIRKRNHHYPPSTIHPARCQVLPTGDLFRTIELEYPSPSLVEKIISSSTSAPETSCHGMSKHDEALHMCSKGRKEEMEGEVVIVKTQGIAIKKPAKARATYHEGVPQGARVYQLLIIN
ncbi:uncharacterized protein H6S33_010524 [Morchella sextelata]|uniref:uncharacterized protein n=1 Tax=Morchella sextelata TaxID=1174677 RepID=UPI001D0447B5|nr:uncharacterized protein H6S33_010524 [Morchella sextelata]KAH0602180.1 hypothetical protein H6S33_010524 [Morchella sextelata]